MPQRVKCQVDYRKYLTNSCAMHSVLLLLFYRDAFDEELKHDDTTADDINAETGAEKKDVVMADPADGR